LCGIAGFTHSSSPPGDGRIQAAVQSLIHRGPDQQGAYESSAVSLGAARLKIIGLEGGDQPIVSTDGRTVIAFNGEIYNHAELRFELERLGHRFRSRTDTETVLAAFREWDTDCFPRLRGMFAAALWSEPECRLVLVRDRLGIKPLYLARRGRDLYFGSELKAILIHPEIERNLSLEGLDCYLALNYVPYPWTLVDGVEKLKPGSWLEWRDGKVRSDTYWTLPPGWTIAWKRAEAAERLDVLLRTSVKEHLLSDVPLGVWLSGGVDSSTLLHYASQAAGRQLKTFSVSFPGYSFDEGAAIRRVAAHYGTDHHEISLDSAAGLADAIEQFAYYSDEPNADAGAVPVWFLARLTRQNATVALSGEGADEVFGGYVTYRANELARRVRRLPAPAIRLLSAAVRHWPPSDEKIGFEYMLQRFLEGSTMPFARAHVFWNGTFADREKPIANGATTAALAAVLSELERAGDRLLAYLWFDQKYYLPDNILTKVDRISMAHSIEVRPPFLDHRIVEFAAGLPPEFKVDGRRQKVLLKELMRDRLPSGITRRPKCGFDIPAHEWLRGPLKPLLLDTLSAASEYNGVFDLAGIAACARRHLARKANLGYHLWGLIILFLWMKKWRIQTARESTRDRTAGAARFTST
jgi:asparagine synthase (glutamine-hydrolysing)